MTRHQQHLFAYMHVCLIRSAFALTCSLHAHSHAQSQTVALVGADAERAKQLHSWFRQQAPSLVLRGDTAAPVPQTATAAAAANVPPPKVSTCIGDTCQLSNMSAPGAPVQMSTDMVSCIICTSYDAHSIIDVYVSVSRSCKGSDTLSCKSCVTGSDCCADPELQC